MLIQNKEKERNAMKPIKEGKVREIYDNGDSLIMVATALLIAFANIIPRMPLS